MNLTFVTEARFYQAKNGKYYSKDISFNSKLFYRYLNYYEKIFVIARVFKIDKCHDDFLVDNVEFLKLSPYSNITEFILHFFQNIFLIFKYTRCNNVVISRGGGFLSLVSILACKINGRRIGIEVIGDPNEVFVRQVMTHPLTPFLRFLFRNIQKKVVKTADSVIYVTKSKLQNTYPAKNGAYVTYASNVMLLEDDIARFAKGMIKKDCYQLISIGSLEQMYKSPDVVIGAIHLLLSENYNVKLTWVGDGAYLNRMKELVENLKLQNSVLFTGTLSKEYVKMNLDNSDVFVLVSRTEGLPRAMVEAMARGLPCIGSNVGGIPELLSNQMIIEPNDSRALADKIKSIIDNRELADFHASINLERAKEYLTEGLEQRRLGFHKSLVNDA
jgi:glycosyltransferase involved in cell wall biosynthesis